MNTANIFKRRGKLPYLVVAFVVLFMVLPVLKNIWIDFLWFKEIGYSSVFIKTISSKIIVGIVAFTIAFLLTYFTLKRTVKSIPNVYTLDGNVIDINNSIKKPANKFIAIFAIVFSFFMGSLFSNALWQKILLYVNQVPFNEVDPLFGKDISYYFFNLSLYENVLSLSIFLLIIDALFNIFVYSLYYKKTNQRPVAIFKKIGYFLFFFFILLIAQYRLNMYNLLYSTKGATFGAGYTDIHVSLKLYYVLMVAALVAAITLFVGIKKENVKLALLGPAVLIGITLLGSLSEFLVQSFVVNPNEINKEEQYIKRSIEYTKKAYNLETIEESEFPALLNLTTDDLENSSETIENIRINDFRPTQIIYNQLQSMRLYYKFPDVDIDRYDLDGTQTQVFLSGREIDQAALPAQAQTWINKHLKYTHGYGAVVSPVNQITPQGQPQTIVKNIPPESEYDELKITRPEIYFGNLTNDYVITNTLEKEFDYPIGNDNAETLYEGSAGIPLNFVNQLLFSLDNQTLKILISSAINSDSKILINRNIKQRIHKIAPFLTYDRDPYLVIDNGELYWIIDAYTKSNRFPYSQMASKYGDTFNYVRNSVKVVVNAYNGTTTYYLIDKQDPIASTYRKIFPKLFKDIEEMPEGLKMHLRYPVDLFDVQSHIFADYHMSNPRVFYNREDAWSVANEQYQNNTLPVRPYYINMKLPGNSDLEFMLVQPFTPLKKDNMVAWFAARNDGDNYGQLQLYKFPKQKLVYGPMQIESRINQDSEISKELTLWGQQGSSVIRGNLLVIPIKESILYVEPLYIQSENSNSLPEVKRIIAAYGDKIVMERTLEESLKELFGSSYSSSVTEDDTPDYVSSDNLDELIASANELYEKAQESLRNGDWASYGKYMDELESTLQNLKDLN